MFLDIKVAEENTTLEFKVKGVKEISEHVREWEVVSLNNADEEIILKFREEAYILKKILVRPKNLLTNEEVLIELISEILKQEHESRQEGFDDSGEGDEDEGIQPYDPKKISIRNERWSLAQTYDLIDKWKEIDLNPEFQRNFVWDLRRRSQLIESLMLRIPVPAFYLAETLEGRYQVVDGLQRLTTIRDFMSNQFSLKGLEYLKEQEGKYFFEEGKKKGIDREFIRQIQLTQINVNIIEAKSPTKVKFDVFRRVNTGGKPLNNQEIRNCLANEKPRRLINSLAQSKEFKEATGGSVRTTRMQAQELVLRFISFYQSFVLKSENWIYKGNMTEYLDGGIERLNSGGDVNFDELERAFLNSMKNCLHLFGEYAFRKCLPKDLKKGARKQLINKSLFTTWSVLLSKYANEEIVESVPHKSFATYLAEELDENKDFWTSVSYKTNDRQFLELAFKETGNLLNQKLSL